jgi:hypothetical protein
MSEGGSFEWTLIRWRRPIPQERVYFDKEGANGNVEGLLCRAGANPTIKELCFFFDWAYTNKIEISEACTYGPRSNKTCPTIPVVAMDCLSGRQEFSSKFNKNKSVWKKSADDERGISAKQL